MDLCFFFFLHKSPILAIMDLCFFFFLFCITKSYDIPKNLRHSNPKSKPVII